MFTWPWITFLGGIVQPKARSVCVLHALKSPFRVVIRAGEGHVASPFQACGRRLAVPRNDALEIAFFPVGRDPFPSTLDPSDCWLNR